MVSYFQHDTTCPWWLRRRPHTPPRHFCTVQWLKLFERHQRQEAQPGVLRCGDLDRRSASFLHTLHILPPRGRQPSWGRKKCSAFFAESTGVSKDCPNRYCRVVAPMFCIHCSEHQGSQILNAKQPSTPDLGAMIWRSIGQSRQGMAPMSQCLVWHPVAGSQSGSSQLDWEAAQLTWPHHWHPNKEN